MRERPALVVGRIEMQQGSHGNRLHPVTSHAETALIYNKRVQSLVAAARLYAGDPYNDEYLTALLVVARGFSENV